MATLDDIARELYAEAPAEFTAARNARAAKVKTGDPEFAKRIGALKRASVSAWVVGQLVRHRASDIDAALSLAAEMREAQDELDAPALSELTRARRRLTAALARDGASLARDAGVNVSAAALEEVSQTLQAAMTDAAAAAAVTSGRLVRALQTVGFDPVDLTDAVAGGEVDATPLVSMPKDDLAERRARRAAEKAAREAEQAASRAERALTTAEAQSRRSRERVDALALSQADLERDLARVSTQLEAARAEAARLDAEASSAAAAADAARLAHAAARAALGDGGAAG